MTFINEKISEADSRNANWKQFFEYQNAWKSLPTYWTIDRDRSVFFLAYSKSYA
jgi:hypothetical protein